MARRNFSEYIAEVGGQGEIAAFVKLIVFETGPAAVNFPTTHTVSQDKHRIRMTVVRAAISILAYRPAKLRHRQHNYVIHSLSQILVKRRDTRTELLQQIRELTA